MREDYGRRDILKASGTALATAVSGCIGAPDQKVKSTAEWEADYEQNPQGTETVLRAATLVKPGNHTDTELPLEEVVKLTLNQVTTDNQASIDVYETKLVEEDNRPTHEPEEELGNVLVASGDEISNTDIEVSYTNRDSEDAYQVGLRHKYGDGLTDLYRQP